MLLSTFVDLIFTAVQRITGRKSWQIMLLVFFGFIVLVNGVARLPEEAYQRLSQNPFVTRTDIHFNNYWQETILLPLIAYYSHLNTRMTFSILCFSLLAIAYALFANLTAKKFGATPAFLFTTVLMTSPLTTVILAWLGTPDGLTLALMIPFLFTTSLPLIFLLAVLGTTNHIVFLIAVIEILTLRWLARENIKWTHVVSAITGGAAGYLLVKVFLTYHQIQIISRFGFIFTKDLNTWFNLNLINLPLTLFSLFNIQWLILAVCLIMFFNRDRRYYFGMLMILLFNYGISFFTLDTTRIFSLLSWGILIHILFHSHQLGEKSGDPAQQAQFLKAVMVIGLISLFTPRYFSWIGEIHTTPFLGFIEQILR